MPNETKIFVPAFFLLFGALGCSFLSSGPSGGEIVFPATKLGTAEGEKATKEIGPAGGTLGSPDGRMTITVPPGALAETVTFGIQPVTKEFEGGLGGSYRLEPEGKTFSKPLDVSFRYDDHDLEGTVPTELSLAYQDNKGAWRMQRRMTLARDKKTISVSTTHFSVWTLGFHKRLVPATATVHAAQSVRVNILECRGPGFLDKLFGGAANCGSHGWGHTDSWIVKGEGTLKPDHPGLIYTAPVHRPSPNVATIELSYDDVEGHDESESVPCGPPIGNAEVTDCQIIRHIPPTRETTTAVITILDRGYKATGRLGDVEFSGSICSLDKPFVVHNSWLTPFDNKFDPATNTWAFSTSYSVMKYDGSGTFTIEGAGSDYPKIRVKGTNTLTHPYGGITKSGTDGTIDLIPWDNSGCSNQ